MPETKGTDQKASVGETVDRKPVSSVKLPAALTASIDARAGAHGINRSEAIRQLVEFGPRSEAADGGRHLSTSSAVAVEELLASQLEPARTNYRSGDAAGGTRAAHPQAHGGTTGIRRCADRSAETRTLKLKPFPWRHVSSFARFTSGGI